MPDNIAHTHPAALKDKVLITFDHHEMGTVVSLHHQGICLWQIVPKKRGGFHEQVCQTMNLASYNNYQVSRALQEQGFFTSLEEVQEALDAAIMTVKT
ncbi:hypothetical protein C8R44DRAFT_984668 [Mycena epipterygia]|nr:hypothetical protein C8R44DRAFT_895592 [Mycena epipterygia]KAJ7113363.1 hypothetical protein C8R44DRAFT_984667 [Mycena epipterygia]KAJ7113365.1 hypothetical protein C8R44DRAFT_984668 [Mycena epipterygia]